MRCYICDVVINEPHWDNDHGDFAPCGTCQMEIMELNAGFCEDDDNEQELEDD